MSEASIQIGVAGVGGYAAQISDVVLESERGVAQLAAVCDPALDAHTQRVGELRERGVTAYGSFEQMLDHPGLEMVWLPLPIDLHRPFTERALAAGKAVLCEKPAAGTVDEVDAMIRAQRQAGLPAAIGFQDIYNPSTMPLKRRLLEGEIGRIRRISVQACWPRSTTYFDRAGWAGRIRRNDQWVLDSPAQNALSHFIMLAMFFAGPEPFTAAAPHSIQAELYRAADIENYDTISARVTLENDIPLLILLTHACEQTRHPQIRIEGERGSVHWQNHGITVTTPQGEDTIQRSPGQHASMLSRFIKLVRGEADDDTAVATLEMARHHTAVINAASESAPVLPVPSHLIERVADSDGGQVAAIRGIEQAMETCAIEHRMLHESGELAFTQPPATLDMRDYNHFAGPARQGERSSVPAGRST